MGTMKETAEEGDRYETLIALRDLIAGWLDEAKYAKDVPPLSKQLVQITKEIEEIEKTGEHKITSIKKMRNKLKAV